MYRITAVLLLTGFGLLVLGVTSPQVEAQAPGQPAAATQTGALPNVRFEVASIKRNRDAEAQRAAVPIYVPVVPGRSQTLPGGRLRGPGMTVREFIRDAYGYRNRAHGEIVGYRNGPRRSAMTSRPELPRSCRRRPAWVFRWRPRRHCARCSPSV